MNSSHRLPAYGVDLGPPGLRQAGLVSVYQTYPTAQTDRFILSRRFDAFNLPPVCQGDNLENKVAKFVGQAG